MRRLATWCSCALLAGALAPAAAQQDQADRPEGAQRIVRTFDFEEKPLNPEPVPKNWFRAQHDPPSRLRPGFPAWNKAAFDSSFRASGEWSVKLPTQGGSTALRLSSGVIAAIPGADYEIAAMVRTDGIVHSRARMSARFLDDRRNPIPGAEQASALFDTGGEWRRESFALRGDFPAAAWVQIDLELLQPRRQAGPGAEERGASTDEQDPMERQRVLLEDVSGAAWFDDVVISQIPRIALVVASAGNVTIGPAAPEFTAEIRDLTGEHLRGRLSITGIDGETVATESFDAPGGQEQYVWRPALNSYGWGRATLEVSNDVGLIASTSCDFAWVPPLPREDNRRRSGPSGAFLESDRFLLIAEDADPSRLGFVAPIVRATGSGAVQLPAWTDGLTRASVKDVVKSLDALVERLAGAGASITLSLSRVPSELGKRLKIDAQASPLSALAVEDDASASGGANQDPAWRAYLSDILSKFGQRVRRWQVGRTGEPLAFWRPTLERDLQAVEASFSRLVPKPVITLPWAPEHAVDSRVGPERGITVTIPWETPAEVIPAEIERIQGGAREGCENTFVIESPPAGLDGSRSAAIELTKRAALAWSKAPRRIAIESPWRLTESGADPTVALPVWRQIVERLGGRRVAGELLVGAGARCLILDGPRGGALVGWADWASPENATVEMYLGNGAVTAFDPFGNAEPVPLANGVHRVVLGSTPTFVEGINVELARFRAGFSVDPPSLPSEAALHSVELVLRNPWSVAISGTLRVIEPSKWKIEPRVLTFDVPAGESQRLPIDLSFGVSEESGTKQVIAEADVSADARYPRVRLSAPLEIGLSTTTLSPSYAFLADASGQVKDVSLTLSVTNNGDAAASMRVFALAPGFPRQEATISALGPGQSAVRRFLLPGGVKTLMGQKVRVGVVQVGGAERLNKSMLIQ